MNHRSTTLERRRKRNGNGLKVFICNFITLKLYLIKKDKSNISSFSLLSCYVDIIGDGSFSRFFFILLNNSLHHFQNQKKWFLMWRDFPSYFQPTICQLMIDSIMKLPRLNYHDQSVQELTLQLTNTHQIDPVIMNWWHILLWQEWTNQIVQLKVIYHLIFCCFIIIIFYILLNAH